MSGKVRILYKIVQCKKINKIFSHNTMTDHHSSMMNVTSRLAVKIRYLPDFEFSWSDNAIEDISPSEEDAKALKEHAIRYIIEFLVTSFTSLSHLAEFIPAVEPLHPVEKSEVVPMKLLLKDEKSNN